MLLSLVNFAANTDICNKSNDFFGLIPWYHYLPSRDFNGCEFQKFNLLPGNNSASDVPLVLLAVVDDLLRVAGLVAVAFVIIGAVRYVTSQGNPEDASSAQNTVINALIGLAIAIVATLFVSFLGNKLGGP